MLMPLQRAYNLSFDLRFRNGRLLSFNLTIDSLYHRKRSYADMEDAVGVLLILLIYMVILAGGGLRQLPDLFRATL